MSRLLRIVLALVTFSATLTAQTTPQNSLLALSKRDHTLAIIDPATLQVVAKVPVGNDPHEVIASADGTTAYVSNYGFGSFNTLAVIDLVNQKALPSIDLGPLRGPHGLTFVGGKVWFTAEAAKAIGRYDPATQKVDGSSAPGRIALTCSGSRQISSASSPPTSAPALSASSSRLKSRWGRRPAPIALPNHRPVPQPVLRPAARRIPAPTGMRP